MLDKERDKVEKKIDGLKKSEGGAFLASDRYGVLAFYNRCQKRITQRVH